MENKIDNQLKDQRLTFVPLLPNYFKKVGLLILLLTILFAVIVKIRSIELGDSKKEVLKYCIINIFILGMLLIAWAKDKIEDELTVAIRIKSMVFAFIVAICCVIFKPLSDLVIGSAMADMKAQEVVFIMLALYFITYYLQKKAR